MPPSRAPIPATYALVKLFLRIITLLLSIIVLIFLIYMSVRYTKHFPVAYAAVSPRDPSINWSSKLTVLQIVYAFFLDTTEILMLSDRHRSIPQLSPLLLLVLELGALGLLAGGCVTMAFADLGEPYHEMAGYKYPADPWRTDALWVQVAVG
jgi:hypothetical protein